MQKKFYPSFGQALVILLYGLLAGFAGAPLFVLYIIWKNSYTYAIGNIGIYLAAFIIPTGWAIKHIKRSGDSFSLAQLFSRKMNFLQVVYLILLTIALSICIDYLVKLLHLPNFFSAEIDSMLEISWLGFIALVILPAFFEEVLLRGVILHQFLKMYSARSAILLSAILFGVMHINPSQVLAGFIAGCFLGWVYLKTKNIKYCILVHFVNNGLAWMSFELDRHFHHDPITTFVTTQDTNLPAFCITLVILITGIGLLNKFYNIQPLADQSA